MSTDYRSAGSGNERLPAEEYKQRRRIQEIRDLVKHIREQRRRAEDELYDGHISKNTARRMYRMAVHELINDSRYTIENADQTVEVETVEGESQEYSCWNYFWLSADLGSINIPGEDEPYRFTGLESLRSFPDPLVVEVTEEFTDIVRGRQQKPQEIEIQPPMKISENAFVELLDFWGMHGLDITTGDGVETWSFNEVPDEDPEEAVRL